MMNGKANQQALRELTELIWSLPVGDYLASGDFSRFCREHALSDDWKEFLQISLDKPDLYGAAVIKNAFFLFLGHIFHSRQKEFLHLFSLLLAGFRRKLPCGLPLDELGKNLLLLGYTEPEIKSAFRRPGVERPHAPGPRDNCCPAGER
jgi:hypothetical protein